MNPLLNAIKVKLDRKKRYDLPLHRGSGGGLVAWTVGVMTYLTVLMLVLVFALSSAHRYWESGLTGRMTIEVAYNKDKPLSEAAKQKLVKALNALHGVEARALTLDDISGLIGPWLGTGKALSDLPLPFLVDVIRADNPESVSLDVIKNEANAIISEAVLDTHQEWLADLLRLAKACRMILIAISIILALTTALTVAATARTRLALHKEEVDLLHLIGATDAYIARQFQRQAFRLAVEGAAGGMLLAFLTLGILTLVKHHMGDTLVPQLSLSALEWLVLLLTPLIAGLIAMIASRFTVLRALKEIP